MADRPRPTRAWMSLLVMSSFMFEDGDEDKQNDNSD